MLIPDFFENQYAEKTWILYCNEVAKFIKTICHASCVQREHIQGVLLKRGIQIRRAGVGHALVTVSIIVLIDNIGQTKV